MILKNTLCFWLTHKVDHQSFCYVMGFLLTAASSVLHAIFFSSVTRRYERGCQNKVKNWEESFNKLVNSLFIKINIHLSIYILCTTSHLVILSHWQSYLVYKLVICLCLTLHCLIFWNGYWNGCWLCCKYFSVVV